jgi:dolichol-phosphate mannosyltransferase
MKNRIHKGMKHEHVQQRFNFTSQGVVACIRHLLTFSGSTLFKTNGVRFATVNLLAMIVDLLAFQLMLSSNIHVVWCQITGFFSAIVLYYGRDLHRAFSQVVLSKGTARWAVFTCFVMLCMLVLFLRSGIFLFLIETWYWSPQAAIIVAILITPCANFIGTHLFIFPGVGDNNASVIRWRTVTIAIVAYVLVLRLAFMGVVELLPEEAYYWNYAQHLDIGYLDHPPLIAWLIWFSTSLFGKTELLVRMPSYICWIISAFFIFRLTLNFFDRATAFISILLVAVLPIYFWAGFFMMPDAPLYAAWTGCLYFLERALIANHSRAWYGVGLCMGLGMLAKYTIALLGLSTIAFLFIDRQARHSLLRPGPYLAALCAMALFTPVLVWNAQNDWVSFMFQGPRRWTGSHEFSLHMLIGSVLLLLTPIGLLGIVKGLFHHRVIEQLEYDQPDSGQKKRHRMFALIFMVLPLSIFVIHSFFQQPKMNWTGPIWFVGIPFLSWDMATRCGGAIGSLTRIMQRLWMPTIISLLLIYGGSLLYMYLGLPGLASRTKFRLPSAWRELSQEIQIIRQKVTIEMGSEPIIAGMDKYGISSELAFYSEMDRHGVCSIGGSHLCGGKSLMWRFWCPQQAVKNKNIIMIDYDRKDLMNPSLSSHFIQLGDIYYESIEKHGRVIGYFYWRVGYGYRG